MQELLNWIQGLLQSGIGTAFQLLVSNILALMFILVGLVNLGREFGKGLNGGEEGQQGGRPVGVAAALASSLISFLLFIVYLLVPGFFKIIPAVLYFFVWCTLYRHITHRGYIAIFIDDMLHIAPFVVGFALFFGLLSQPEMASLFFKAIAPITGNGQ